MSRTHRIMILLTAAALLAWAATVMGQTPVITNISPQPTSAGTSTSIITITGQNIGGAGDRVFVPDEYQPMEITVLSRAPGQLVAKVPYNTWSGTLAVLVGTENALADFSVSFCSDDRKWHDQPMHWEINQNGAPGVPISSVVDALNWAFGAWECASGFDQTYDGLTSFVGSVGDDGHNIMWWKSTGWADPNIIALAGIWMNTTTGEILDVDVAFNSADFSWSIGGSATTMDIQNIATHEAGHVLGLLEIYGGLDAEKTMYGLHTYGETFARTLEEHDVLGAEFLYPHAGRGNIREGTPTGWWGPIVVRDAADATNSWAPLPSTLPGYTEVYASFSETNDGLDCLSPVGWKFLYLDGMNFNNGGWYGSMGPGKYYNLKSQPVTVPGGRHTLRVDHDVWDEVVESNENDNTYEAQFAWTPFGLADQHPQVRPAPPELGSMSSRNCEGFMFTGNWWGGVAATPTDIADDYDLFLFDNYSDSQVSYQSDLIGSQYVGGRTDWVVVNGNITGEGSTRTVGTTGYAASMGAEVVVQQSNQVGPTYYPGFDFGDSASTGERLLVLNQNIKVHEFYLGGTDVTFEFVLRNLSGGADLDLAVLSSSLAYHSPSNALALAQDFGPGWDERALFEPASEGWYGAVVYKRGSADLPLESHYELICRVAPPNLDATDIPAGHDGPLVARNMTGATAGNLHFTPILDGNTPNTYLSFSVEQEGPNESPQWLTDVFLDDQVIDSAWSGEPVPMTSVQWFDRGPFEVKGGRHSLLLHADATDAIDEAIEVDNFWLTQFVWSPLALTLASGNVRDAPPEYGPGPYFNCDGFSVSRDPASAWVVGMTPWDQNDDYDLYVYEDYVDSGDGFDTYYVGSGFGQGSTDFVVGHYLSPPTNILAGVIAYDSPVADFFTIQANDSVNRQDFIEGIFLFQGMGPLHVVDVYEAYLTTGQRVLFKLEKLGGASDLKVRIFDGTAGDIHGKWNAIGVSSTFAEGEEWLVFEATADAWYPIVVSREDYRGLGEYVEYNLTWGPTQISGVEDPYLAPTKLMFMAPAPNPTSRGTALAFELPGEGKVNIEVFDVRGHRVMTVADTRYPAGRHHVRWTGRDDQGRLAATGVYYARLRYAGQTLTRRMTVLR